MILYVCFVVGVLFASNPYDEQYENPLNNPCKSRNIEITLMDLPLEIKFYIFSYLNKEDRKDVSCVSSCISCLKNENIKKIRIRKIKGINRKDILRLFSKLPNLKGIALHLYPGDEDFLEMILSCSYYVNKFNFGGLINVTDNALKKLSLFKNLIYLNLGGCIGIKDRNLTYLPQHLSYLDLSWCDSITDAAIMYLPLNLKFLNLRGCDSIADVSLIYLLRLTDLQFIDLKNCNVTSQGIEELSRKMPKLTIEK